MLHCFDLCDSQELSLSVHLLKRKLKNIKAKYIFIKNSKYFECQRKNTNAILFT